MAVHEADRKEVSELETVSIDAARDKLGDLAIRAGVANERIIVTRFGKPTLALVSIRDLERLLQLDASPSAVTA